LTFADIRAILSLIQGGHKLARRKSNSKGVSEMISKQMRSDQPVYKPTTDIIERDIQIGHAINWYNALSTDAKERSWYHAYAKEKNLFTTAELAKIKVSDAKMFHRAGRFAQMVLDGFPLDHDRYIQRRLAETKEVVTVYLNPPKVKKTKKKVKEEPKVSVQDRMNEKAEELGGEILNLVDQYVASVKKIKKSDDGDQVNIESFLNVNEVKPLIASRIIPIIKDASLEWDEALTTKDKDIKEGYSYLTTSEQKRIQRMYKKVLDTLEARSQQKRQRATRKKKVKTPTQLVSKVQYLASTTEYGGLSSVDPEKIIGANRVILFNIKYRQYTIVEAENDQIGLTVKGTTIQNIDETKSSSKRVRETYLKSLLGTTAKQGIRAIRKEFNGIKAKDSAVTGRLNKDTLILKVL